MPPYIVAQRLRMARATLVQLVDLTFKIPTNLNANDGPQITPARCLSKEKYHRTDPFQQPRTAAGSATSGSR